MAKYHIYTDGSSRGNPGKGGWATIVMNETEDEVIAIECDYEDYVTNNRMELKAMICALGFAASHPNDECIIFSDSAYVVNSINSWMRGWAANGWKNSKKQMVENVDLMKGIWDYISRPFFNADVRKCDGHAGNVGNELADALAINSRARYDNLIEFYEIEDKTKELEPISLEEGLMLMKAEIATAALLDNQAGDNWNPID